MDTSLVPESIINSIIHKKPINQHKIMNTIHTLAIAAGLFGFVIFGMQAKPNQKPTSTETVLILELIKQLQTQMAENQKQTNQQMAELKTQMAENQKQTNHKIEELRAEMQTITQKVDRIGFYFDMLQYVFLTIVGSAVIYILALFREQIKNFIINLFTSSKKINVMNIKTITNQSTLTIIIIAIMLLISLGNAQAQTYRDRDNDGLIEISNIEQLDSIRYNLTGTCSGSTCNGYELTRNLDFNSASSYRSGIVNPAFTTGNGWNPIGTFSNPDTTSFNTTFEGNGFTIDHLYINRTSNYVGLFGRTESNSRIRNIGLTNVSVTGNASHVGGLVGRNNGTISQSYATGAVMGNSSYVGGLVGYNDRGTISQSHATGSFMGTGNSVGGLVGDNINGTISQCHATGAVTSSTNYVGGLVGQNNGTISQSYATGAVSGASYIGGLVGSSSGTISQSYATGAVSGSSNVGGLVGNNGGTILHGSWNKDAAQTVSGTARINNAKVGIGTNSGTWKYILGLTLSALQSPTGIAIDSIRELGPGFLYYRGQLPKLHTGARVTVNGVNFTELLPTLTNIGTSIANVIQGTATTRATLSVGGVNFTANVIDTTSGRLRTPYTITNIQNGVKQSQTLSFASLSIQTFGQAPFVLSASSSAGLAVVFSASNTRVNIISNTVSIRGVGTVDITASHNGNDTVYFASQTQILTISKGNQSISFASFTSKTVGNAPFVLSATSSAGLSVLFSASNTLVSINNNTVTIRGVGTVRITATQTGNENYESANAVSQILSIQKGNQSITFGALANKTFGDAPFVLTASSSLGLPVLFSASNTLVSINNNTVTIRGAGTVNITASNTGNNNYGGTSATQTLLISVRETVDTTKSNPTLTFTAIPNLTIGQKYTLIATSNSPVAIIFTSSDTNTVSIRGNTATAKAVGNVMITASQASNATYNVATSNQNVTVTDPNLQTPTLTFTAIPNLSIGQRYVMTATSNSPVTIIFTSSDTNKVSIRGNTATAKAIGNVVITASQEANATYNPATAQQTVTVINNAMPIPINPLTLIEKANSAIRIYPNPANDYITIQYDKTQKVASVKVYDITGKSYELGIRNYELGLRVDLKTLSKGEYIIILYGEKGEVLKIEKIIKE